MENQTQLRAMDPKAERRLVRKIDRHLIPLVMVLYLLAILNRSSIGNVENRLREDPHLSINPSEWHWVLRIFYISYIPFQSLALLWKVFPPHRWAAFCIFGWAVCSILHAAACSWAQLMVARFLLGAFQGAFTPGVPFLLSQFYLPTELGLRCGFYLASAPLATAFSGVLAYAIFSIGSDKIVPWRLLFLVEGLPVILAAVVAWFLLRHSLKTTTFRNRSEQAMAAARISSHTEVTSEKRAHGLQWQEIPKALGDYKLWITGMMYFSCNVSFGSLPYFLPKILRCLQYEHMKAEVLTAPPYLVSFLVVLITTYIADRTSQRGIIICLLSLLGAAGYIMLALTTSEDRHVRYIGVFLAASGVFPATANITPWVLNNQGSTTKKGAAVVLTHIIGQTGPLLGTSLFWGEGEETFKNGMWICGSFMLLNAFLALVLRTALSFENRRLVHKKKEGLKYCL